MSRPKQKKGQRGRTPPRRPAAAPYRRATGLVHRPVQKVNTFGADDAAPMPELAEGLIATPMHYEGESVTLYAPTGALEKVLEIAEREGLEFGLDLDVARVDVNGQHGLARLTRVTGEDGTDFVRAFARVFVKPDPARAKAPPEAWQGWLDLPTRYVGMMLEASRPREEKQAEVEAREPMYHARPKWQGSWTFDKVYDRALGKSQGNFPSTRLADGTVATAPDLVLAIETVKLLDDAHLVRIEADQVELLPDWESSGDAWDFAADAHIPFDPLYFEFEGAGGVAPAHSVTLNLVDEDEDGGEVVSSASGALILRGALVWRGDGENLHVAPIGDIYTLREGETLRTAAGRESVTDPRAPAGQVVFGHSAFEGTGVGAQKLIVRTDAEDSETAFIEAYAVAVNAEIYTRGELPGVVILPFDRAHVMAEGWGEPEIVSWGSVVLSMALRVLACLSIMETEAVVVEDAKMEVRDWKRAQKRGWKISQQVYLRPTRKGPRGERTGNRADYTHRFWVSGHYKHHPIGSRLADHRPDLVRPCTRVGAASCGMCRRIWTAPFIKGPDDKPLVVKSLVKRKPRDPEAEPDAA